MRISLPKPAPCTECGDGAIFHRLTYISIVIDELLSPFTATPPARNPLVRLIYALERRVTPHMIAFMMRNGLATQITEPDDDVQLLALMLWNEAKERGIRVSEFRLFGLPRNVFLAEFPDGKKIAYEGIPTTLADLDRVTWLDNKAVLKEKFRALGLPVARGGTAETLRGAKKIYATLTPPVIVKPYSGSGSRHTTLHIDTEEELTRAFAISKQVAPSAVVEEELIGPVYRATVVDGRFAASLRRDQPHVVGDGVHTVAELVAQANEHPARSGPYFHQIKCDAAAEQELAWQELSFGSIPDVGQRVLLNQKINWSVGGTTTDTTDDTHPDNVALFEEVAHVLKAPIVGIDFIIADISRSWKEQERCGIIECNSMPFFDNHHLPFEGTPRNVAALIWDGVEAAR